MTPVAPRATLPARGTVIGGKYEVERVLGVGGMGVVVAAMHLGLDERVAIKMLLPELVSRSELVARFLREGRAAIKVRGEHVARVLDVGTLDDGVPFIVMEYLDGADLDQVLTRDGTAAPADVAGWVLQACEALAEAHGRGLVHRDLKPANLFLTRGSDGEPFVKVLDFGISKIVTGGEDFGLTADDVTLGSPRYMAPEQARRDRPIDARTDVWALGTILYEMLCGVPPFDAETLPELVGKTLMDAPTPMATHRAHVPPELEAVVLRCLEKDPDRRYASVADLAAALGPFAGPHGAASADRVARILATAQASDVRWSAGSLPPAPSVSGSRSTGPGLATTVEATRAPSTSAPRATGWATTGGGSPRGRRAAITAAGVVAIALVAAFVLGGRGVGASATARAEGVGAASSPEGTSTAAAASSGESARGEVIAVAPDAPAVSTGASAPDAGGRAPKSVAPSVPVKRTETPRRGAAPPKRIEPAAHAPSGAELFDDRK